MRINIYSNIEIHIKQEKIMILILFLLIIQSIIKQNKSLKQKNIELNCNYEKLKNDLNLTFDNKLIVNKKIRIGIYTIGLTGAGMQRSTSLMINNFYQIKLFEIILFTINIKEENEYFIPKDIKRIIIKYNNLDKLIKETGKRMIDILIYQFPIYEDIEKLNKLRNIKVIFYLHQCFLYWIY